MSFMGKTEPYLTYTHNSVRVRISNFFNSKNVREKVLKLLKVNVLTFSEQKRFGFPAQNDVSCQNVS